MNEKKIFLIYLGRSGAGPKITLDLSEEIIKSKKIKNFEILISKQNLLKKEIVENKNDSFVVDTPISNKDILLKLPKFIFSFIKILKHAKKNNIKTFFFPMTHIWNPIAMFLIKIFIRKSNIIYICHAFNFPTRSKKDLFEKKILKTEVFLSNKIITLTSKVEKDIKEYKNKKNIITLFHPIFNTKRRDGIKTISDIPTFLLFGRILKYKGISLMLESVQKMKNKNIRVIIAGSGKIEDEDKEKINIINKDSEIIKVKNYYLSEQEVEYIWEETDICMIPYLNSFQSGVIPIAINKAIPSIITPHDSLIEQCLINTENPIALISAGICSDSFSKIMDEILEKNIYRKISGNCIKVQKELSWENFLNKVIEYLYEHK